MRMFRPTIASIIKARERIFVDIMRVLKCLNTEEAMILYKNNFLKLKEVYAGKDNYLTHKDAEDFIKKRLTSSIRKNEDYILNPNQMIGKYTISDLTRIFSLSPETNMPNKYVRTAWAAFSRSILGFSKVANIGLVLKMLYITHGFDKPSLVYVGQATVIGKGVTIDLTGGVLIGARNYTSSFWSDVALHGHLHIGDGQRGTGGTLSRLGIEPYIIVLNDDIAFPPGIGYIEAAFYEKNHTQNTRKRRQAGRRGKALARLRPKRLF